MFDRRLLTAVVLIICLNIYLVGVSSIAAQNYERYRPLPIRPNPQVPRIQEEPLAPIEGSDRILVKRLNAVRVLDSKEKIDADNAFPDMVGLRHDFDTADSLVYSHDFAKIINGYLGSPISLRQLNEISRDIIKLYRDVGQPVVDVIIPEQRITAGTVQIVVVESRVGSVQIQRGSYFDADRMCRWIECTQVGSRIYESAISNDLFWLNQNPFRRVDVDLRPGAEIGTTDVVFQVHDVRPFNAYLGYDDTGVRTLKRERFNGGMIWGNAFGRGGTLSYQYTTDTDMRHLHAHAVSYLEPLNRRWSFQTYASWAGVSPAVLPGLLQDGESWMAGLGMIRQVKKDPYHDISWSFGFDFKSTNNNLEFGGISVSDSKADLAQLRVGYRNWRRCDGNEYSMFSADAFIGPGGGFSSDANTAAMNTVRPGTRPDYIYARARYERLLTIPLGWELTSRVWGQVTSDRLLFSETLGFGGFDSVRGYDQRVFSGDAGWIVNLELGPAPYKWCGWGREQTLRMYALFDGGGAYIKNPLPGDLGDEVLASAGFGFRWSIDRRTSLRFDYGYTFQDVAFQAARDRAHIGFVHVFGPRPGY